MSSGPQGPGNRAGGTWGMLRAAGRKRGWEGAWFPLGDSRESKELRTSQAVGVASTLRVTSLTVMSLGSWENSAWEQPHL